MRYGSTDVASGLLYRYRPYRPDELRLLLTAGQIRFSDANRFNDPWDCRPLVSMALPDNPGEVRRWVKWVVGKRLQYGVISPESADAEEARLIGDPSALESEIKAGRLRVIKSVRANHRVLCLSEDYRHPLMWSHYASAHTGICQIFDAHDDVIGKAEDVIYSKYYPGIDFPISDADTATLVLPTFLTKADYWNYEQEFRVIAKENTADGDWPLRCHQGYVQIKPTALLGLILGCQMKPSDQKEAIAIAKTAAHKVDIYNAELDEDSYGLRITKQD
jgi:hypothetical protein